MRKAILSLVLAALAASVWAPPAAAQAREGDKIQLNFNGVSLKEVIRAVEKLSGRRFLFDEKIVADKTVNLFSSHPLPADRIAEIFDSILEVEGLAMVKSGEGEALIYKIVLIADALKRPTPTFTRKQLEELRPGDQIVTLLLPLEHAVADDVASTLKGMATLPDGVMAVPGTNMVRLTDFAANAKRLAALLEQIDREGPRMAAETVVLENVDPVQLAEEIRPLIDIENRLEINRLQRGVQQQVRRIMGNRARNMAQMINVSGAQYNPVAVSPVPRLGAVIVSAEEARLPKIVDMIKRLDIEDPQQKVVRYYALKFADPLSAATILSGVYDITVTGRVGGRGRRNVPSRAAGRKAAVIIPDEDLKTLVIVASQKIHGEIAEVLSNLDQPGPNENTLKIYTLDHADLTDTATVLARLFGLSLQQEAARLRMFSLARARRGGNVITAEEIVIPDENLGALLVVAQPALHEKVAAALTELDVEGPGKQEVRIYALTFADPDEVAATVGALFDYSVGRASRGRGFRMRSQADRSPVIVANPSQNSLMVAASAEAHAEIAEVVAQLDVEGPNDAVVRYIPVTSADVQEVAATVSQVFGITLGTATQGRRRPSRNPFEDNVVIPDENLSSLIVVAPRSLLQKIEDTVKKIDTAGPGEKVVKFYPVKRADVDEVARIVASIFEIELGQVQAVSRGRRNRRQPATRIDKNAVVIPHPELSSVVVVAPKTTQDEVARVIDQLDNSGPQTNDLRYYPLAFADPTETANVISQIFGLTVGSATRGWRAPRGSGASDGRRVLTDERVVIPDLNLNSLIVVAPPEVQDEVTQALARIDVAGPRDNELRFYEVDDDFADTAARTLSQIFNIPMGSSTNARNLRNARKGQRVQFGADPIIIPDAAFGSIIVNAPSEVHGQVEQVLDQLRLLGKQERMAIRFYKLKNTDAEEIAQKIGSLFHLTVSTTASSSSRARSTSSSTRRSGSSSTRRRVEAPAAEGEAKPVGDPDEEEPGALDDTGADKEYSWGGDPVIVPDKNLNSIIVIAPEYLHTEIGAILERLDIRRPQVLFEVAIIDLTSDTDLDVGFEFTTIDPFNPDGPRGHGLTNFGLSERSGNATTGGFPTTTTVPTGGRGIYAGISKGAAGSLPVLIKLLQGNNDVNIRSTPLLLVNDNEEAEFSSLRSEPTTRTSQGTSTTSISFDGFVDAGTVLRITPHVSEGNYIRLEINLSVDSWLGSSIMPGIPPPKSTNSLDTSITVPNERTVIIGGLTSVVRAKTVEKVPLLGDIPLLGYLFRHEVSEDRATKLFLFIKPTILAAEDFVDLNQISKSKMDEARQLTGEDEKKGSEKE